MSDKLFEYAVLKHPTKKAAEDGSHSTLIVDVCRVVAANENAARLLAIAAIPRDEIQQNADRLEVAVRPF